MFPSICEVVTNDLDAGLEGTNPLRSTEDSIAWRIKVALTYRSKNLLKMLRRSAKAYVSELLGRNFTLLYRTGLRGTRIVTGKVLVRSIVSTSIVGRKKGKVKERRKVGREERKGRK
jgi:hypothetical protein